MERSVRSPVDSNILSKTIICDSFRQIYNILGNRYDKPLFRCTLRRTVRRNADKYECKKVIELSDTERLLNQSDV